MADVGIGRVVDNKYEIIAAIGKGGMSNVWLGRDRRLNKLWAVKEIKPSTRGRQAQANRQAIIDEANFMKRLDHPAIPRVVDIIDTGASIFVVMDYVNGTALNKVLAQQGEPFSQDEVIDWGIQLCDVLEYLHNLRPPEGNPVVYRDLKPPRRCGTRRTSWSASAARCAAPRSALPRSSRTRSRRSSLTGNGGNGSAGRPQDSCTNRRGRPRMPRAAV